MATGNDRRFQDASGWSSTLTTTRTTAEMLQELVTSGRIVDIMIAFVIIEVVVLLVYRRVRGRGVAPYSLLVNIGAGGSLMLALRAVMSDASWAAVAACLVSSLVFHSLDIVDRWQARTPDREASHGT
jgi:hypothetical protein